VTAVAARCGFARRFPSCFSRAEQDVNRSWTALLATSSFCTRPPVIDPLPLPLVWYAEQDRNKAGTRAEQALHAQTVC